ncbi:universal stress protein [Thermosulfuriphilus sp.]
MESRFLVCLDGKPHTRQAIFWALRLARALKARLVGLHVLDPYLKKFYNELYSQGRREYLQYVDSCLEELAYQTFCEFSNYCCQQKVTFEIKARVGDPGCEILSELREKSYDLLILGQRKLSFWDRLRSRKLPEYVAKHSNVPILIVKQS